MSSQITDMYDYMCQMTTQMSTLQVIVNEMRDEFRSFRGRYMHPTTSDYHNASTTNEENADEGERSRNSTILDFVFLLLSLENDCGMILCSFRFELCEQL
ncbi:unnamed protein product [Linum trigynum]|uniref:Uncharacterized protein n=1 Tax=Linum trigynum TaxID=586398 RepID=A0AAV2FG47_9ROSI